jgi:hypothetical protein
MVDTFWVVVVLGIVVALALVWYFINRKSGCGFDYYSMFVIGLIWIPLGFALKLPELGIVGIIMFIYGLLNKKKWRKRCMWVDLSKADKWVRVVILIVLILLLALGVYFMLKGGGFLNGY